MFCPRCHRQLPEGYRFCPYDGEATGERPAIDRVRVSPTHITDALLGRRYKVRGFVGKGGMARVYLAEDEQTGRPVAVKVLEEPYSKDESARRRFLREARAVSKIGHPNIVSVLEAGLRDGDGAPYLVMEFLFGESMGAYLNREGTLATDIALPALRQAASALSAAHCKGVIHRDVKPDNLFLIGEPGDPYELKVLDFGLSKLQTGDVTAAGVVMGTPAYMAPEQVLAEPVDARVDVYSLGMVMYRALSGWPAFDCRDEIEMVAHQVHTQPAAPSARAPDLDSRVEEVILTAICKDPGGRYPAMDIFFDDLGKLGNPRAKLWASAPQARPFTPTTTLGKLVSGSLARVLGQEPLG